MSMREFNQNVSRAARVAEDEPLFVTRRGKRELVLMTVDEYERLRGPADTGSAWDALAPAVAVADEDDRIEREVWAGIEAWRHDPRNQRVAIEDDDDLPA